MGDVPEEDRGEEGYYGRITRSRMLLGLGESATLDEIESQLRLLLKRWHPDLCPEDPAHCHEQTRAILEAARLLRAYCRNYRYSFSRDVVEQYLPPDEWWMKRFGERPPSR
ncbi:MAG: J domain-containing protein [Magnetococcales bacterium]|nr:J domain-containing protein [Magnetococcales bacterium]